MTWKEARLIAIGHVRRLGIPRRLDGVAVQIADYTDEDTLLFLKAEEIGLAPGEALRRQRLINQAFARELRKRGAVIQSVPVNVSDYFAWIAKHELPNTPANRAQFIAWLTAPDPKPKPHTPDDAYEQGWGARMLGKTKSSNPYLEDTDLWVRFNTGWEESEP